MIVDTYTIRLPTSYIHACSPQRAGMFDAGVNYYVAVLSVQVLTVSPSIPILTFTLHVLLKCIAMVIQMHCSNR